MVATNSNGNSNSNGTSHGSGDSNTSRNSNSNQWALTRPHQCASENMCNTGIASVDVSGVMIRIVDAMPRIGCVEVG